MTVTETVAAEVQEALGDNPGPAAARDASQAMKWWDVVEIEEMGLRLFVRLPNDWQHKDIREKAQAAKARRRREMKDPETDGYQILEAEIELVAENPEAVPALVEELLALDSIKDRQEAVLDIGERDEFEHIRQDQERFVEMHRGDPALQQTDEFQSLARHLNEYGSAIEERLKEIQQPKREALTNLGLEGLLSKVREIRIDAAASQAFMDTYSFWQVFAGTMKLPDNFDPEHPPKGIQHWPRERYFKFPDELREAEPVIYTELSIAFEEMENRINTLQSAGN